MQELPKEADVIEKLVGWGRAQSSIRAMILTSTRARPDGLADLLSDYDIILAVTDIERFAQNDDWVFDYGMPMVRWGDQSERYGMTTYFRGVVYADYIKIDYSVWPNALLNRVSEQPALPNVLDVGYRVLLDKDGRTSAWKAPSLRAHIPAKPTQAEYQALVEEFWWSTTYVAKSLWRDELAFARWCLEEEIKVGVLRQLLEWRIEIDHDWSVKPGVYGRGLKRLLPVDIWADFASTYVGPEIEDNWSALFDTIVLFRRVAKEVGDVLGYHYPQPLDDQVSIYLNAIQGLPDYTDPPHTPEQQH